MAKAIIDPLDLSRKQINKSRWQIVWRLKKLGRSYKSAVASADRWEKSLRSTIRKIKGIKR